jgi:hypothetical protein
MSEITATSVEMVTQRTTTSTSYTDVTGAAIADSWFDNGDVYWIEVRAVYKNSSGGLSTGVQCLHGSTAFAESEEFRENYGGAWQNYSDFFVWTAVSGEGFKVQFKTEDAAGTAAIDYVQIIAWKLTGNFVLNTDYFYDTAVASTALTDDYWSTADNATITFTPSEANQEWMVRSTSRISSGNVNRQHESRINLDDSDLALWGGQEGEGASDLMHISLTRSYNALSAAEHTFEEQSRLDGGEIGGENRTHSKIGAINLDKFVDAESVWSATGSSLSQDATYGTNVETLEFTPSQAGNIVVLGDFGYNPGGASDDWLHRARIETTDVISGITSDLYKYRCTDSTDLRHGSWATIEDVAASAQTLDVDACCEDASDAAYEQTSIIAFSLELPSSGQTVSPGLASESDTALAVTAIKSATVGLSSETDIGLAASALRSYPIGLSSEADSGFAIAAAKARAAGLALEADTALAVGRLKELELGLSSESDTAFGVTVARQLAAGLAVETDSALAVGRLKELALGLALESDLALGVTSGVIQAVGLALESDTALAISIRRQLAAGLAIETDTALAATVARLYVLGLALEADTALGVTVSAAKVLTAGLALESDTALGVTVARLYALGLALEGDSALSAAASRVYAIGLASELDSGLAISAAKLLELGLALETDAAFPVIPTGAIELAARNIITAGARAVAFLADEETAAAAGERSNEATADTVKTYIADLRRRTSTAN